MACPLDGILFPVEARCTSIWEECPGCTESYNQTGGQCLGCHGGHLCIIISRAEPAAIVIDNFRYSWAVVGPLLASLWALQICNARTISNELLQWPATMCQMAPLK